MYSVRDIFVLCAKLDCLWLAKFLSSWVYTTILVLLHHNIVIIIINNNFISVHRVSIQNVQVFIVVRYYDIICSAAFLDCSFELLHSILRMLAIYVGTDLRCTVNTHKLKLTVYQEGVFC